MLRWPNRAISALVIKIVIPVLLVITLFTLLPEEALADGGNGPSDPPLSAIVTAPISPDREDSSPPAPIQHNPIEYTVQDRDSLDVISQEKDLTTDEIKWSNPDKFSKSDDLKPGDLLLLPPLHGIVYTILKGDTLSYLASRFQIGLDVIVQFNSVPNVDLVEVGQKLIFPGAKVPVPEPVVIAISSASATVKASLPSPSSYSGGNHFAYGYCTWYVANKRAVPWFGNAGQWYWNAQAYGFAVGSVPSVGAIMVTWESSIGHVAYVEAVNGDGSWTVSEMNYTGWNRVDFRTIKPGGVPLIGFIY